MFYKTEKTKVNRDLKNSSYEDIEIAVKKGRIDRNEKQKAVVEEKYMQNLKAYKSAVGLRCSLARA